MAPVENKRRLPNRFAEWEDKPVKGAISSNCGLETIKKKRQSQAANEHGRTEQTLIQKTNRPAKTTTTAARRNLMEMTGGERSIMFLLGIIPFFSLCSIDAAVLRHGKKLTLPRKSKLRQKEEVSLGPKYRGARVSRTVLERESDDDDEDEEEGEEEEKEEGSEENEGFDDPETANLEVDHVDDDFEIDSDEALAESDEEKLRGFKFAGSKSKSKLKPEASASVGNGRIKKRMTAIDLMSDNQEEDESEVEDEEDDEGDSEDETEDERNGALLFDNEAEEVSEDEDEDEGEDEGDYDEDEEDDNEDDEDEDDNEEEVGDRKKSKPALHETVSRRKSAKDDNGHSQIRDMMGNSEKIVVNTISQKAKEEAIKGAAIRTQRRAFDSILNLRVRLQKALVAANTFSLLDHSDEAGSEPYQAAEEAALKLWNTIDSVRHSLLPDSKAKAGMKRKRSLDIDSSSQEIWETMEEMDSVAAAKRRQILGKWSERIKKQAGTIQKRELIENTNETLLSYLDGQMLNSDRLIKKARTPRSCAPAQAAKKVEEDKNIYDDADFYQLLLKELVDQRSVDAGAPGESVPTVRWAALGDAKSKKIVDRRASKGRKLRFTVHEKLQNFLAPEDRRSWEDQAIDRFFGALFGQKMELKEEDVSDEEMGGVDVEEEGLKLFRS